MFISSQVLKSMFIILFLIWKPDSQREKVASTDSDFQKDNNMAENKSPDMQDKFAQ